MIENVIVKHVMIAEFIVYGEERITFEKYVDGGLVRVIQNNEEINHFTNYEIGDNSDRYEKACIDFLKEFIEE
jgi:hypothetical protein